MEAEELERQRQKADSQSAEKWYDLGENAYQRKKWPDAVLYYFKAAELGHSGAMFKLGVCYYNGQGVAKDFGQAVYWYRKAASLGYSDAMYNLGHCYYRGRGVAQDHEQAVQWYYKAAALGHPGAMYDVKTWLS